ncbi:MAG: ABC transporter ATP-binding protein [Thermodesulfobacteriota bacterium]
MNPSPAIEVENLGKRFRINAPSQKAKGVKAVVKGIASPFAYLGRSLRRAAEAETVWALRGVSFTVPFGEVMGVIGRNGAGKSTLLKILSRITDPSEGQALIRGRVGALLQVGTGFHPELSGRENTFLNGAIMGMSRAEVRAKFDEIMAFAEIEKFIDTPVKYYSSGMYVRLAFAVAAHLEPEILIVDEVLAVGDVAFQRKCMGKMGQVAGQGRTVLLVSHNMEAILGLCGRSIWLESGMKRMDGPTPEVVQAYTSACMEWAEQDLSQRSEHRTGDGRVVYTGLSLRDGNGAGVGHAVCGQPLEVVLGYRAREGEAKNASAWFWVRDYLGRQVLCFWSRLTNQDFERLPGEGRMVCRIPRLPLAPGSYVLDLAVRVGEVESDKVPNAARLEVAPGDFFGSGRPINQVGEVLCDHSWTLEA